LKLNGEATGDLSGFLDRDIDLTGEMSFKETLRIDGKFQGNVRKGKCLVIGETAEVNAEIDVDQIFVSGHVQGKIRARERVELHRTARVEAEIQTKALIIEEGAHFEGQCSMQTMERETQPSSESPRPVSIQSDKTKIFEMK
jgi:cytoskeletal protein CcmA (bactofilin family)